MQPSLKRIKKKNLIDLFYYRPVKTDLFLIYVVLNVNIIIFIIFALHN